tara:strand:+ start:42601 stop:43833 length:1233 start_codon:yes stop_codon:yes gene_type:complete
MEIRSFTKVVNWPVKKEFVAKMSQLIVFRRDTKLDYYLAPIESDFSDYALELVFGDIKDWSLYKKSLMSPENIIVIDYAIIAKDFERLNVIRKVTNATMLLAFDGKTIGDKEWDLLELCRKTRDIEGVIDYGQDVKMSYPMIRSLLDKTRLLKEFAQAKEVKENLNKIMRLSLSELQRVKKLHEQLVPLRQEKIKGLTLSSKFAAGMSNGGEFFDLVKREGEICIVLSSAQSYVTSSIILSHFESLADIKTLDKESIETFLEELINECRELELIDRDQPDLLQFFVLKVDMKNLQYFGYSFGDFKFTSNTSEFDLSNNFPLNENYFDKAYFKGSLDRAQQVTILSPGVSRNLDSTDEVIVRLLEDAQITNAKNFLNEVFFQLKKSNKSEFLKHDASVLVLEVDPNVIVQI